MDRSRTLLVFFLFFSFSIRLWQLDKNPAGFFADEASVGLDAYKILASGRDRHGDFFPLFFKGFNFDNVSPYQVYLTVPFVALFGLNERAVRLAPVFWSTVELFIFFLLLAEFIPKRFALLGSLLLSISPWHFHISRINMGDYYSWTLLTLSAYLFFVKASTKKNSFYYLSVIFFGLATYSYTPSRMITPLLFALIIFLTLIKRDDKFVLSMVFLYTIILTPFIYFHLTDPHSFQRIKDTIGIDIRNRETIESNKLTVQQFSTKYFLHYLPLFLFQKGDADFPGQYIRRHSISGLGLLYPYQAPLILAGLVWLAINLRRTKRYELTFTLFLLILFPLADSLTSDSTPFATRSYLGILPLHILISFGLYGIYQVFSHSRLWKHRLLRLIVAAFLLLTVTTSLITLLVRFVDNPKSTSDYWGWQMGPRDIISYFKEKQNNYDNLIMTGSFNGSSIFIPFYAPEACNNCKIGDLTLLDSDLRQLFALRPEEITLSQEEIIFKKNIYYPNSQLAFVIFEVR